MMRLLEGHSLTTRALIEPESMGLTLTERDSSATPAFGPDAPALQVNDWMQDLEEPGAGIVWRVKTIDRQYDTGTVSCSLEHLIQSLGDRVLGEVKTKDIAGGSTCTARQAVEYILAHQSDWALGDFAFDGVSNPYHFNGETLKAALEKVTGSLQDPVWEYDFTVYPFLLHIRQQDQTVSSEMRAGRNLTSFKYTIDKTRMFTRFYPIGKNNKKPSPEYVSKNEGVYGRVDKKETDQSKATAAELIAWANERLSRHAEPLVTVTVSGLDLSESTGESLDKLTVCHLCRVPLPEYGTTILEKVTKLVWRDKIKDRESVAVTLANALADVQSIIKEEKARGGGAARTAAKLNEENELLIGSVESGLYTRITQTASELRWEAHNESASLRSIISQTAESIRQTVEDDVNSLRTQIVQTAESIRQEVTNEAASLRSSITQTAESIRQEVANEAASLRSSIAQTAESIRQEVADEAASIRSSITQQADRISLVVEGSGPNAHIKPASIVAAINDSGSSVTISGDKIVLDGKTLATYLQTKYLQTENLNASIAEIPTLTGQAAMFSGNVSGNALLGYEVYVGGMGSYQALSGGVKTIVRNTSAPSGQIGIVYTKFDGTSSTVNFNIADTEYFQTQVSAARLQGRADAGVQINTEDGQIERALNSETKAVSITAAAEIVYNSGNHTYTATGKARAGSNNIELDSATVTSGTEAYNAGVAAGEAEFSLATVTLQGAAVSITPVAPTSAIRINDTEETLYEAGSGTKYDRGDPVTAKPVVTSGGAYYYKPGTAVTYYEAGEAVTRYKGNGGSFTVQGAAYDYKIKMYGMATLYYKSDGDYYKIGSGDRRWFYQNASEGIQLYRAGTVTKYARGDSETITPIGTSHSVTPIDGTTAVRLGDAEGYYKGNGGGFTPQGSAQAAYRKVASGGDIYYKAAASITRYQAGSTVSDTYYTRS